MRFEKLAVLCIGLATKNFIRRKAELPRSRTEWLLEQKAEEVVWTVSQRSSSP